VVSFSSDGLKSSRDAVARRILDPQNTVYSAKRLIGLPFRSDEVQRASRACPTSCARQQRAGGFRRAGSHYTIPEISGFLLGYLAPVRQMFLSDSVSAAVIPFPPTSTTPTPSHHGGDA